MADRDDTIPVEVTVLDEIVDSALQPPGPGGDGAPIVGARLFALKSEVRLDAIARIGPVGIDVAVVERGNRVATVNRLLDTPDVDFGAAALVGGAVVLDAGVVGIHPDG